MKNLTLLFFSLFSLILLSSCSKENTNSRPDTLIGTWAVVGISSNTPFDFNGDGRTETDIYGNYNACQRDIVLTFEQGGYGQARQGCTAYTETLSWQFSNNNNTLNISIPSGDINLDITQFDNSTIRGNDQVSVNGQNFIITYTLARR